MSPGSRPTSPDDSQRRPLPRPTWDPTRGLIPRARLVDRLRGSAAYPIVLAAAPAGFGKTTILAEWDSADPRPFAWVPVDERHDDPSFLAGSIASALDAVEPLDAEVTDALGAARSDALLAWLQEAIAGRREPFVLVLDDVHRLTRPEPLKLITDLALRLDAGSQMALASRGEPGIPVGRLRAEGRLAELRAADLAMTRSELCALLATRGLELDAESIRSLLDRTEGWPVANYLATVILGAEDDPGSALERVTGEDRVLVDYLREELLSGLAPDVYEFVVSCAALEQLSGPLCDAALGRRGSAELLRRLSRSNLLVIPLDRADREYRYHSLLREALQAELEQGDVADSHLIHKRASSWYAERGDFGRSITHAVRSGDAAEAGLLIYAATSEYVSRGREATLRRFLDHFSDTQIAGCPPLALARAATHLAGGDGDEVARWTTAARAAMASVAEEHRPGVRTGAELIRVSGAFHGELAEMRATAAEARDQLPSDNAWVSLACLIEGAAIHLGAGGDDPRPALEEGIQRGALQAPTVRTLCQAQRILVALDDGDEQLAWNLEEQASDTIQRFGLGEIPTEALVLAVSALIRGRRGRTDDATIAARRASSLLSPSRGISSWFEAETRVVLAQALLLIDDVAAAAVQLDDAEPFLRRVPDSPALQRMYDSARASLDDKRESADRWPLTKAEMRLLRLLPTHLSFREIGAELYVSTNTVKSQARSIYRKLGVGSRAEAVSAAQVGGVIPGGERPSATVAAGSSKPSGA